MKFLGALNLPLGPDCSEYGGIPSGTDGPILSSDANIFVQFAWYF